ncbi:MAG: lectin-like protein [Bacteroidota bacterium]|nr:lectin-like protein [Bacteroidota bacterium]
MFQLFQRTILYLLLLMFSSALMAQNRATATKFGYYRYIPERLNWEEHKKRATQMGGQLACITNATENEQVRRIADGEIVWIGGIRRNCGNGPGPEHWRWSNGKPWNYTNWSAGEPNNHAELNENRVWLYDTGKWNDAPSWVELPAVYEIPFQFDSEKKKTSTSKQSMRPQMSIVPPSGTWHGQWQTMVGAKVIDRGNDDLMLTFHDNGTITGGATDPRNGTFKVTGTWSPNGKVKFTYSNPGNGNHGETAHGQVKGNRMETDWKNRHCSGKAQYKFDQSSLKDINSSVVKNLNVSGAGSVEVNGSYVFVAGEHPNRIFETEPGHYQHTTNPAIFIGFQNCGKLFNKPEWNKWVIFTEKGARYAAHTNKQINVAPSIGKWETVHHWPAGVEEAGFHPAPNLSYYEDQPKTNPAKHSPSLSTENIQILEAIPGKPVRFKLNNHPSSNDAWVGIYAPGASDKDHGEQNKRWKWLREIDANNVSFPKQTEGDWSIRVFSDGGYTLYERKDFTVKPKAEIFSKNHNTNQYYQKEILNQTIQNKINNEPLSYYKFIPEKMTWDEHNNRAIAMGGNLASISNALENEQVRNIIYCEGVWIGGIRKGCGNDTGADHWYWSNGKEWSFTNWQQYEPNNYGEVNENRVQMLNNGNWNDLPNEIPMAAVYELPLENTEDYYENTNANDYKEPKIKKRPFKFILGPAIAIGSFFQFKKFNKISTKN